MARVTDLKEFVVKDVPTNAMLDKEPNHIAIMHTEATKAREVVSLASTMGKSFETMVSSAAPAAELTSGVSRSK